MDTWEASEVVFQRLRALDPENASKIVGMLLLQDSSEKELIRLAFGPDHLLHSFVARARAELAAKPSSPPSPVLGPVQAPRPWRMPGSSAEHAPPLFPGEQQMGQDHLGEAAYPDEYDCWSPAGGGGRHDADVASWRPCLYYARGFCKNGSSCRFLHGVPEDDAAEREAAVMQRAKAFAARPPPPLMDAAFPFSPSPKGLNFMFPQQHPPPGDLHRKAAVMLGGGGEDLSRFAVRSPRMDAGDIMNSPAARQIYLTFPADSSFSEEDVSNYFSIFGPVQDVRIPYQQKRMFGFVTFVYAETVRLILSHGNPHFVCDARVLVKPYKEKGRVPERIRKMQHPHQAEFSGGMSPTGFLDPRGPFDLEQPQIGPRLMRGDVTSQQDAFLRRKLDEQQQAAELQRAIELQSRRFMGLELLDLKNRGHRLGSPMSLGLTGNGNVGHLQEQDGTIQDNKLVNSSNSNVAMSAPASSAVAAVAAQGGKHEVQQKLNEEEDGDGTPKETVNPGEGEKRESGPVTAAPDVGCGFQESGVDDNNNLPEFFLASPSKAKASTESTDATAENVNNISPHHVACSLFPPASGLEVPPYNSCFLQVPRFGSGHEAIGL